MKANSGTSAGSDPSERPRVLVTGSSIAGPTAAWGLQRSGFDVVLVERSAQPRQAGQNIDVRGPGRRILRHLGVEDEVMSSLTGEQGTRYVRADGSPYAVFPRVEGQDGPTAEIEILRGQLARIVVGVLPAEIEQRFGDHVVALDQDDLGVDVTFASGARERFDLVLVAEGRSSRTRRLLFAEDTELRDRGVTITYGTIEKQAGDGDTWDWFTATDGRVASIRPDNVGSMRASMSFATADRSFDGLSVPDQLDALERRFTGAGWRTGRILDGFRAAPEEFYVQRMEQVVVSSWSKGRVALLGDAAWGSGPTGMGTTLALLGAHVLAGELGADRRGATIDPARAFRRYEDLLRRYVDSAQGLPPGGARLLHPSSRVGVGTLQAAHWLASRGPVRAWAQRHLLTSAKGEPEVPDYPLLVG